MARLLIANKIVKIEMQKQIYVILFDVNKWKRKKKENRQSTNSQKQFCERVVKNSHIWLI